MEIEVDPEIKLGGKQFIIFCAIYYHSTIAEDFWKLFLFYIILLNPLIWKVWKQKLWHLMRNIKFHAKLNYAADFLF